MVMLALDSSTILGRKTVRTLSVMECQFVGGGDMDDDGNDYFFSDSDGFGDEEGGGGGDPPAQSAPPPAPPPPPPPQPNAINQTLGTLQQAYQNAPPVAQCALTIGGGAMVGAVAGPLGALAGAATGAIACVASTSTAPASQQR
jgi:hypothetical protein